MKLFINWPAKQGAKLVGVVDGGLFWLTLFGDSTGSDTVFEQANCKPMAAVELQSLKPGFHA
jgi:hypothetical protein